MSAKLKAQSVKHKTFPLFQMSSPCSKSPDLEHILKAQYFCMHYEAKVRNEFLVVCRMTVSKHPPCSKCLHLEHIQKINGSIYTPKQELWSEIKMLVFPNIVCAFLTKWNKCSRTIF